MILKLCKLFCNNPKDIDETIWPGMIFLKAQMNGDLFTDDLKKKRSSNESFWLIGQPDTKLERIKEGEDKGKCRVKILGFAYYNPRQRCRGIRQFR